MRVDDLDRAGVGYRLRPDRDSAFAAIPRCRPRQGDGLDQPEWETTDDGIAEKIVAETDGGLE